MIRILVAVALFVLIVSKSLAYDCQQTFSLSAIPGSAIAESRAGAFDFRVVAKKFEPGLDRLSERLEQFLNDTPSVIERFANRHPDFFRTDFTLVTPELDPHHNFQFEVLTHELAHVEAYTLLSSRARSLILPPDWLWTDRSGTVVLASDFFNFFQESLAFQFQALIRAWSGKLATKPRNPPYSNQVFEYTSSNHGMDPTGERLLNWVRTDISVKALRLYGVTDPRFLYLAHFPTADMLTSDLSYLSTQP